MADDGDTILKGMAPLSLEYLVRSKGEGAVVGPNALPEMTPNGILLGDEGIDSRPFKVFKHKKTLFLVRGCVK